MEKDLSPARLDFQTVLKILVTEQKSPLVVLASCDGGGALAEVKNERPVTGLGSFI